MYMYCGSKEMHGSENKDGVALISPFLPVKQWKNDPLC